MTVTKKYQCPCCHFKTLDFRGEYDICPVCFWEDTGSFDLEQYSSPNHMTLREGQQNFKKFGACSEASIKSVRSPNKDEI